MLSISLSTEAVLHLLFPLCFIHSQTDPLDWLFASKHAEAISALRTGYSLCTPTIALPVFQFLAKLLNSKYL